MERRCVPASLMTLHCIEAWMMTEDKGSDYHLKVAGDGGWQSVLQCFFEDKCSSSSSFMKFELEVDLVFYMAAENKTVQRYLDLLSILLKFGRESLSWHYFWRLKL